MGIDPEGTPCSDSNRLSVLVWNHHLGTSFGAGLRVGGGWRRWGPASPVRGRPSGQIQMEVHNLNDIGRLSKLFTVLERLGYRLFHAEHNAYCVECYEIALIHETLVGRPRAAPGSATGPQGSDGLPGGGENVVSALQALQDAPGTRVAAQFKGSFLACSGEEARAVEGAQAQAEVSFGNNLQHRRQRMQASLLPPYKIDGGPFRARMPGAALLVPPQGEAGALGRGRPPWVCTGFCGLRNAAQARPLVASVGVGRGGGPQELRAGRGVAAPGERPRVQPFHPPGRCRRRCRRTTLALPFTAWTWGSAAGWRGCWRPSAARRRTPQHPAAATVAGPGLRPLCGHPQSGLRGE